MTGSIAQAITFGCFVFLASGLTGCGPDYSPNTYNGSAMQQANKVDTGIVIGYREVKISDDGTVGAVTGGAAGGILGAETGSPAVPTALAVLGGTVVGGVVGSTIQHATGDTTGWEYIVREPKGDLISVTQREPTPIPIGQKVLVIEGKQARIVPDYATAAIDGSPPPKTEEKHDADQPAPNGVPATAVTPTTAPAAAGSPAAPVTPPAPQTPASAATANAAPPPTSADKNQTPGDQPAPANVAPPAAASSSPPPASAGSDAHGPPAPPS